ncbi:MAG: hypothetical protein ACR2RF_01590 [Geminicoccaceae bacterium]
MMVRFLASGLIVLSIWASTSEIFLLVPSGLERSDMHSLSISICVLSWWILKDPTGYRLGKAIFASLLLVFLLGKFYWLFSVLDGSWLSLNLAINTFLKCLALAALLGCILLNRYDLEHEPDRPTA